MSFFDDNEDRIVFGYGRRVLQRRETVRCAFCGVLCTWADTGVRVAMVDPEGKLHNCRAADADEFDDVT